MDILLSPPIAFALYLALVGAMTLLGRYLAPARPTAAKSSTYASGEAPPKRMAAPGYRPFFVIALFFALLHLGVLMIGTGSTSGVAVIFVLGLGLTLLALILG